MPALHRALRGTRLLPAALLVGVAACGGDTPAKAIYALAHDLEHGLTAKVCSRIYAPDLLPQSVARPLGSVSSSPGRPASADSSHRDCESRLRDASAVEAMAFHEPRVHGVRQVDVATAEGITGAAIARVAFDGEEPQSIPLVEHDGDWLVVVALPKPD